MIPEDKSAAVTRGLREAFGVTEIEDIRRMTKGLTSALVFRVVAREAPYLLRIITHTHAAIGPERQFNCMRAAAEAGLAPRVWYTSTEDQISITDFVEEVPLPMSEALVRLPGVLRSLHALLLFPTVENHFNTTCVFLLNQGAAVDGFIQKFKATNMLSEYQCEELFHWYAQVVAVCPRHDPDQVSSHNDLFKPDNILFDGKRVWLVDWEAACRNDRYADLAVVANLVVANEAEETVFLQEYFGQPPDEYQLARLFLMRQVAHMFYAMVFLLLGSSGEPMNQSDKAPEFDAFRRRMWAGKVNLADKETKVVYGRAHWEQLVQNMRSARFGEALRIVKDHATPLAINVKMS